MLKANYSNFTPFSYGLCFPHKPIQSSQLFFSGSGSFIGKLNTREPLLSLFNTLIQESKTPIEVLLLLYGRNWPVIAEWIASRILEKVPNFTAVREAIQIDISKIGTVEALQKIERCQAILEEEQAQFTTHIKTIHTGVLQKIEEFSVKYPQSMPTIEESTTCIKYAINQSHLAHFEETIIPRKPNDSNIQELNDFFNEINFYNDKQSHYYNPLSLFGNAAETGETLRHYIAVAIDRITKRVIYAGTPQNDVEAIETFYQTVEDALCNIMSALKKMDAAERQLSTELMIVELIKAMQECGGRLYAVVIELFFRIVHNKKMPPVNHFHQLLAQLRQLLLHEINPAGNNSVHAFNKLMKKHGKELKIPGYERFMTFDDPYTVKEEKFIASTVNRFWVHYTPYRMIEWIIDYLRTSQNSREYFKEWAKNKTNEQDPEKFETLFKDFIDISEENNYAIIINKQKVIEMLIEIKAISNNPSSYDI